MAPCILFIDEIEKGLAGAQSSGQTDSGVSARMFGTFLTWLNDHTSDVFVVATSNDISRIPAEFTCSGRFNAIYFIDYPNQEQREKIWDIQCRNYGLDRTQPLPNDRDWTGSDIMGCCDTAAMLECTLIEAATQIVPIAITASERMAELRKTATSKYLDANRPGLYRPNQPEPNGTPKRAIDRPSEISLN